MTQAIKDKLGWVVSSIDNSISIAKPCWGEVIVSEGISEDGKPSNNVVIRYNEEADAKELFDMVKDKIVKIPVLSGRISLHLCGHDTVGSNQPCVNWVEFVKE